MENNPIARPEFFTEELVHVVCYSGGHSSALVAIEVCRRYPGHRILLVNHDISPNVEDADIKRFKREVAAYLGLEITYVNMLGVGGMDQFDVCVKQKAFKVGDGTPLCTNRLKTRPFHGWLKREFPSKNCILYYGFDKSEVARITRRSRILGEMGFKSDYPLAFWKRTIQDTAEIGITPPLTYGVWKHANCVGCLRASKQHWYTVYCVRPDVFGKAKAAEDTIGYHIIKGDEFLDDLEVIFEAMKKAGIPANEKIPSGAFWKMVREKVPLYTCPVESSIPCECVT